MPITQKPFQITPIPTIRLGNRPIKQGMSMAYQTLADAQAAQKASLAERQAKVNAAMSQQHRLRYGAQVGPQYGSRLGYGQQQQMAGMGYGGRQISSARVLSPGVFVKPPERYGGTMYFKPKAGINSIGGRWRPRKPFATQDIYGSRLPTYQMPGYNRKRSW